jgi:serine/threonine protein kinase
MDHMHLWSEYEGRTIAEDFPLEKLLRSEGRSAFFSTSNGTGTPAIIRLIEAHFDEPEILARWNTISEIRQSNLITLRKFGQTEVDGTALLYAVMEPTDAALADILTDRALTVEETHQVASSLVPALQALHDKHLVHEHIEPANVLAIGETVKLRSDCIRDIPHEPGTPEAAALKAADVRDLCRLLRKSLTLQSDENTAMPLPSPFGDIISNGMSGAWGLPQIAAALKSPNIAPQARATKPAAKPPEPITPPVAAKPAPAAQQPTTSIPSALPHRVVTPIQSAPPRRGLWIAIALGAFLLLLLAWRLLHSSETRQSAVPQTQTLATVGKEPSPSPAAPTPAATSTAPVPTPYVPAPARSLAATPTQWRVVAYTYNKQSQAQAKVDSIAKKHSDLNPEVFNPYGHAPYLVTVGGSMTREQANALRQKAINAGLPHDTYTQNYSSAAR